MTPRARPAATVALGVAALALLGALAVLAADAAGGPAAVILANAGAIARHGAPVAAVVADLAGALVLGGAVLAGWVLTVPAERTRALLVAAVAACAWTLAQLARLLTSYAVAAGQPIGSPRFGSDLGVYVATDLGRWLVAALVISAITATVALAGTSRGTARSTAVLAAASLGATSMTGHAAGTAGHETATSTMLVHLLAAGVWVGGLAILQLLPGPAPDAPATARADVVRRYSRLALVCWCAMALSGVGALVVRMAGPGDVLTSAYVQLGLIKALLLVLLGVAGLLQRRTLADGEAARAAVANGSTAVGERARLGVLRRLALVELALMGLAIALAAAMSSSPPPADLERTVPSLAETLTGYPLPPTPSLAAVLGAWRPDVFAIAAAAVLALAWWWPTAPPRPRRRTALLVGALVAALAVLCGPLAVYGKVLVSAYLIEHAALLLVVGPLLAAAFDLRVRRGAVLLAPLAVGLLAALLASPLVRPALDSHIGHLGLIVGTTALGVLLGACARSSRLAPLAAAAVVLAAALVLALGDVLLAPSWFGATGRPWLTDALADQRRGGWALLAAAVLWAIVWVILWAGTRPVADDGQRRAVPSSSARTERRRAMRSSRSAKGS